MFKPRDRVVHTDHSNLVAKFVMGSIESNGYYSYILYGTISHPIFPKGEDFYISSEKPGCVLVTEDCLRYASLADELVGLVNDV